jgi:hypothetical protein
MGQGVSRPSHDAGSHFENVEPAISVLVVPSHGVSPLLIDPTVHTTEPQRRAHRRNANVCLWDRKKTPVMRRRCLPMARLLLPIVANGDTGTSDAITRKRDF